MICFGLGFGRRGYQETKTKTKKTKFWETYFGMGGGEKALQCIVFFVFFLCCCCCCCCCCCFWQIADSRWLTLQWNSQWNRKKLVLVGGEHIYIIIYTVGCNGENTWFSYEKTVYCTIYCIHQYTSFISYVGIKWDVTYLISIDCSKRSSPWEILVQFANSSPGNQCWD